MDNEFIDYVMSFYGKDKTYGDFFEHKLTRKIVEKHFPNFYKAYLKKYDDWDCTSIEREMFRDYLFVKMGFDTTNLEYPIVLKW